MRQQDYQNNLSQRQVVSRHNTFKGAELKLHSQTYKLFNTTHTGVKPRTGTGSSDQWDGRVLESKTLSQRMSDSVALNKKFISRHWDWDEEYRILRKYGLLWKMTVGVGGVCSLTSEALVNPNKCVPPPAYFERRGWFRAGLPFFRDDFEMRRPLLPNLTHPEYPITPEAAQRFLQD
ncbi:hypothetical protein J6590_090379 [Homalodisca vitripennis]|nr:hypothetical protein J6590_090379 [Homalodisca vitripennis]